jgi:hypothetical protein
MNALSAGAVLQQARYASLKQKQVKFNNDASIENTVSKLTTNNSIELAPVKTKVPDQGNIPDKIDALIDNKMYRNKFKKLITQGHERDLCDLADVANTKNKPSHFFAKWTRTTPEAGKDNQPTNWQRTLQWLAKAREVARKAAYVAHKLKTEATRFIYKQIWKGVNVERWAVTAEEVRHDKPGQSRERHFAWLCLNEQRL